MKFMDTSRRPIVIAAGVFGLLLGAFVLKSFVGGSAAAPARHPAPLVVEEGEAGKVGELLVAEEALELAEIRVAPAELKLINEELKVSGIIQTGGDRFARVTPLVQGKVKELPVVVGDQVTKGQTLALLDSVELARHQAAYIQAAATVEALASTLERRRELARLGQFARPQLEASRTRALEAEREVQIARHRLAEEQTGLAEARNELKVLESAVEAARAELDVQRGRLERAEALRDLVAAQEIERIRADCQRAEAELEMALARIEQGRARIQGAQTRVGATQSQLALAQKHTDVAGASLAREERVYSGGYLTSQELVDAEAALRLARAELESAEAKVRLLGGTPGSGSVVPILSPISGVVEQCTITLGEVVDPEQVAFEVVNLDRVWARLAISPRDLPKIRIGDPVRLRADSSGEEPLVGQVTSISPVSDETTRAVYVRATLDNPHGSLKAGSFVEGSLITDVRQEKLTVPEGALQEHTGKPTLYVADPEHPGAFEVRHVTLGFRGEDWQEVADGLRPDEAVAVSGTFYLKSEALKSSLSDGCCAVE